MRNLLGKAGIVLTFCVTSVTLAGCFDLMGGTIEEPISSASNPPAPPVSQNNQPTISGNPPAAVMVGDNYSFTPTASDPDGDPLTFSVQNLPMWATFDSTTGTISGVATLGSEGTYANIQVSVSDGDLSASLPQFSVDVTQILLGSTTLTWAPPAQNTDGSPLMDLSAYRLYYGTTPGSFSNQIYIDNPGITTYVVENLMPNTYYFVATSINSMGIESDFSNIATKIVN